MGWCLSEDLRDRVVAFVAAGHSCREAARHFALSASTAIRFVARHKARGTVTAARQGRPQGTGKLASYGALLIAMVEAKPDITLPELAERLREGHGVRVHPSSLSRCLRRHGFTYKKSASGHASRTRRHPRRAPHLDHATPAAYARTASPAGVPG